MKREECMLPKAQRIAKKYKEDSMKEEREKLVMLGKLIINAIKNGITHDDGRKRKFDIIDFYITTPLSFNELFYIIRDDLNIDEIRIYRKFQQVNNKNEEINLNQLYTSRQIFGLKFDENGNAIPETGREVTNEEKENLVNYILGAGLPLTNDVYDAALDRWRNDFLKMPTRFNDEDHAEVLKKR